MRVAITIELLVLFWLVPAALTVYPLPWSPLPVLWIVALYCYAMLRHRRELGDRESWRGAPIRKHVLSILKLFVLAACVLSLALYAFSPALFAPA